MVENMDNNSKIRGDRKQRPWWPKVLNLLLRSCHIGASGVLFGGVVLATPFARLSEWHHLTIATGVVMIVANSIQSRHWPYQGRGAMAFFHIGLVWLAHVLPGQVVVVLTIALAVGVFGSHLPGNIRHWSLLHGRRID
jgi:hypothetical protein